MGVDGSRWEYAAVQNAWQTQENTRAALLIYNSNVSYFKINISEMFVITISILL